MTPPYLPPNPRALDGRSPLLTTNFTPLFIGVLLLPACSGEKQASVAPPVPVRAAEVKEQPVLVEIHNLGNVETYSPVSIESRIAGQLVKILIICRSGEINSEVRPSLGPTPLNLEPNPFPKSPSPT